jgi:hypothetical protein
MKRFLGLRQVPILGLMVVVAAATAGISYASIPDAGGVVHACYKLKDEIRFRLIDAPGQQCKTGEKELDLYSKSGADAAFANSSTLTTLANTVNANIATLNSSIATLSSQLTTLASSVNDPAKGVAALDAKVFDATKGVDALGAKVFDPTTGIAALAAELSSLQTTVIEICNDPNVSAC